MFTMPDRVEKGELLELSVPRLYIVGTGLDDRIPRRPRVKRQTA